MVFETEKTSKAARPARCDRHQATFVYGSAECERVTLENPVFRAGGWRL